LSLRALAHRLYGREQPVHRSKAAEGAALVFVLNRDFVWPFRVLLFSLVKSRSVLDAPIVLISEDETLQSDPLVEAVVDRFVPARGDLLVPFADISPERVPEHQRLGWIAKYALLKWLVFDDYGFERHVFMDADTLCLNPVDALLELNSADLHLTPQFDPRLLRGPDGAKLPRAEQEANVLEFVRRTEFANLNSGVFVANHAVLTPDFRAELIGMARRLQIKTEQSVLQRVLRDSPQHTRSWLSPRFNFHHGHLSPLSVRTQIAELDRSYLLHFIGSHAKPWDGGTAKPFTRAVWLQYAREAAEADPVFASPAGHRPDDV
jgi:hypothetical protein